MINAITCVNGACSANGFTSPVYFGWVNVDNDFYGDAWRCSKCAQAECEEFIILTNKKFGYIMKISV